MIAAKKMTCALGALSATMLAVLAGGCSTGSSIAGSHSSSPRVALDVRQAELTTEQSGSSISINAPASLDMPQTGAMRPAQVASNGGGSQQAAVTAGPAPSSGVNWQALADQPMPRTGGKTVVFNGNNLELPAESELLVGDNADGLTQVTFGADGADFDPSTSADGSMMIFASTQHRSTSDLYLQKVGSRAITQLTNDPANDLMPAISPDGSKVAFVSDRHGSWQLFVMPTRGGKAVQLTEQGAMDLKPSWSPDGRKLAFCRRGEQSGRWELWVIDVANPATMEFIGFGMFPSWSPKGGTGSNGGDLIAFQRARERGDRAYGLWLVEYKAGSVSNPVQIVAGKDFAATTPSWSRDGQYLAYARVRGQTTDVWLTTADGRSQVPVASGLGVASAPVFAGESRVQFVTSRGGRDAVWSADVSRGIASLNLSSDGGMGIAAKNTENPANPVMANAPADVQGQVPEEQATDPSTVAGAPTP
jgi:TolB protein